MLETNVKDKIQDDLVTIRKAKVKILMLEQANEELISSNNQKIKELSDEIKFLEQEMEDLLRLSGERKIETNAGWCGLRVMPDSWEYDDAKIINWCKENNQPYFHNVEVVDKMKLKQAILDTTLNMEEVEGIKITPQESKFQYKIVGGEVL